MKILKNEFNEIVQDLLEVAIAENDTTAINGLQKVLSIEDLSTLSFEEIDPLISLTIALEIALFCSENNAFQDQEFYQKHSILKANIMPYFLYTYKVIGNECKYNIARNHYMEENI